MTASNRRRFVLACQQAFAVAVVTTIAVPAAALVELDILGPDSGASDVARPGRSAQEVSVVSSSPVEPTVRSVPLRGVSDRGVRALGRNSAMARRAADRFAVVSPPVRAEGYATVGVTWAHGVRLADDEISVSVRTLDDGEWSAWQPMDYDADHGPDPGTEEAAAAARPGTDAVVVGDVDDVQVRAATADGTVPEDLRLEVVDPGADVAPRTAAPAIDTADLTQEQGDAVLAASALTGPSMVTPKPTIFSRAQWGADERLRDKGSLHYGEIHAGFVHHTVNANDYSRSQVPALIRGIYAYHTQSRGWSDVGYNFLVDRFGQIWEGRYGGVGRPVVGAHTLGYNDDAFAMSAIGNFDTARPPQAVVDAYARLFAWKLSLHGIDADSTKQWVTSQNFQAINGHRDAGQTACPGRYLYARIPDIRRAAAALQRPFDARQVFGDLSGNAWPDLLARRSSDRHLVIVRTGGQVSFQPGITGATGWSGATLRAAVGDVTGDRRGDVIAKVGSQPVRLYPGAGGGKLSAPTRTYDAFASLDVMTGVGDFDGDGRNDLVGRVASTRDLRLFPGRADGTFGTSRLLARDWEYDVTTGVDDLDRDGHRDLVARKGAVLSLFRGTGTGLRAPVTLPRTWSGYDTVSGRGDLTGDRVPDLLVRSATSKQSYVFPGDGEGGLEPRLGPFGRFSATRWLMFGGDLAGTGAADVIAVGKDGVSLRVFPNSGRRNIAAQVDTGIVLDDINLLLNVGDWDADGHGDLMYRVASTGSLMLRRGLGGDRFAAPVRVAASWNGASLVAPVGDATGDGFPDLMARGSSGDFRIYPSNGSTGFRSSFSAHSAISANGQVGVGLFDGDGAPDNLLRRTDGSVWLWRGNGPGGLTTGRQIASGAQGYSWFRGIGDLDGDRRADVVARDSAGWLWLLRGTSTGLDTKRLIGTGFGVYDYAG